MSPKTKTDIGSRVWCLGLVLTCKGHSVQEKHFPQVKCTLTMCIIFITWERDEKKPVSDPICSSSTILYTSVTLLFGCFIVIQLWDVMIFPFYSLHPVWPYCPLTNFPLLLFLSLHASKRPPPTTTRVPLRHPELFLLQVKCKSSSSSTTANSGVMKLGFIIRPLWPISEYLQTHFYIIVINRLLLLELNWISALSLYVSLYQRPLSNSAIIYCYIFAFFLSLRHGVLISGKMELGEFGPKYFNDLFMVFVMVFFAIKNILWLCA